MKYLLLLTSLALGIGNNTFAQWELLAPLDTVPYNVYCKFFNDSTGVVCSGGYEPDLILLKTWDYGETWDTIYTNDGFFSDIDFVNETTGYLCTYEGPVLKTTDGGYTWNNVNVDSSLEFTFQNMFFLNENVGFGTVYTGGGVWQTVDGGVHWENLPNSGWGYSIFATNICNIYVSDPHYLIKSTNCDSNWPSYPYQANDINLFEARSIFMLDDQIGFIGGNSNVNGNSSFISRTEDGGETWMPVVLNEFGSNYLSFEFINNNSGFAGGYSTPEHPYGLLKTEDSGISWGYQSVEYFPNQIENFGTPFVSIRSISSPTGGDTCYAVGAFGGIWRTFNGGGPTQSLPVSVSENQRPKKTLTLYPNPSSSVVRIEVSDALEVKEVAMYDMTGQRVETRRNTSQKSNASPYEISVSHLAPGCYTVVVRYDNEVIRAQLVVE